MTEAETLAVAFGAAESHRHSAARDILGHLGVKAEGAAIYADLDLTSRGRGPDMLTPEYRVSRIEQRRDRPANRARWQFELRSEVVAHPVTEPHD